MLLFYTIIITLYATEPQEKAPLTSPSLNLSLCKEQVSYFGSPISGNELNGVTYNVLDGRVCAADEDGNSHDKNNGIHHGLEQIFL